MSRPAVAALLGVVIVSVTLHLLPFILYGAHPLGYDTGFYRRYLIQPLVSIPNTPVPGLGDDALGPRLTFDTLRLTRMPTDIILYGSYITFFALFSVLIFFWLRPQLHERGALLAAAMTALSPVGYYAYWYMLWKNFFSLPFLVLAFIAIENGWWRTLTALDILLAISHKTTAIVYLLTLGILFLIKKKERQWIAFHIFAAGAFFFMANTQLAHTITLSTPVGVFLDWQTYLGYSLPLILLIVCGRPWRTRDMSATLIAFAGVAIGYPLLHLPFYERIFVFSDLALIALAAFGLRDMLSRFDFGEHPRRSAALGAALCVAAGLFLGSLFYHVRTLMPLAPESTFTRIESISGILPHDAMILTSSDEAPLFEGWTTLHVAAPGMLHDTHDFEEWMVLWTATSTREQTIFLEDFPRPLYVSTFNDFKALIGTPDECMHRITPYLYQACAAK